MTGQSERPNLDAALNIVEISHQQYENYRHDRFADVRARGAQAYADLENSISQNRELEPIDLGTSMLLPDIPFTNGYALLQRLKGVLCGDSQGITFDKYLSDVAKRELQTNAREFILGFGYKALESKNDDYALHIGLEAVDAATPGGLEKNQWVLAFVRRKIIEDKLDPSLMVERLEAVKDKNIGVRDYEITQNLSDPATLPPLPPY